MKHVGKMKNNGAKVCIVYRTLPGDPQSALVVGTSGLDESYHNSLMSVIQDSSGQQANELAEILAVRKFPDGSTMLEYLHVKGHLKKVPTSGVLVTPTPVDSVPLDELNALIAQQKGVSLDELAVSNESATKTKQNNMVTEETMTPAQLRSKADTLFKEAQQLRKRADELDPPKTKKKTTVPVE